MLKEVAEVDDDDSDDDEVTEEMYEAGKQMVEKASEAFKSRFKKMIVESLYDGGGKARNPPSFEESHLTRLERQLFRVGRESCEDFTRWKYQTNERMETCAMVTSEEKDAIEKENRGSFRQRRRERRAAETEKLLITHT